MHKLVLVWRKDWYLEPLGYIMCHSPVRKRYSTVSKKYYNTRKEDWVVDVCLPFLFCLHSVCERVDDVSCLHKQGAQRYANTYIDRKVGKTIKTLGPSVLIGRTFLGPTPSTEYINTFRPLNLMIAYWDVKRLLTRITKNISEDNHLCQL